MKCKLSNQFYEMFEEMTDDLYVEFECWDRDKHYELIKTIKDEDEFGSGVGYIVYNPTNHCSTTLDSTHIIILEGN